MRRLIYSSKLYKASSRQNKIHAAAGSPLNQELVQQLASYLDEDYTLYSEKSQTKDVEENTSEGEPEEVENEEDNFSMPEGLSADLPDDFNPADNLVKIDDDLESLSTEEGNKEESKPAEEPASEPEKKEAVEKSIQVEKKPVTACISLDVLKGSLNSREDTQGVERLQIKDKELWIYYNDDTNLNDIMTNIIE